MAKEFELWGKTYKLKNNGRWIAIVDFDGTLSDGTHRLHLMPTKDLHLTESWHEFNAAAKYDPPIQNTIDIINGLWLAGFNVIILTGRSDGVFADSYQWLEDNGVIYDHLIMRRREDNRKDTVIKEEALRAIGLENITACFDDSPKVIEHMRGLGLTVYQVCDYGENVHAHLQSHGVDKL